jgi:hypothetical protein
VARQSNAARSRAYRESFAQRHGGLSFSAARRLGRALGTGPGAPAKAVAAAASTAAGADLVNRADRPGASLREQALGDWARQAQALRGRQFQARADVASGRRTMARAERRYDLAPGTLRREFSAEELAGTSDQGVVMSIASADGVVLVATTTQAERELVGQHWHAIQAALEGRPGALRRLEGREVAGHRLAGVKDLPRLRAWHQTGLLDGGPYPEARAA